LRRDEKLVPTSWARASTWWPVGGGIARIGVNNLRNVYIICT